MSSFSNYQEGLSHRNGGSAIKYPNPFFDLANNSLPTDIKPLFRYCRSFFYTDAFLSNVVRKLTEYPVTELLFETGPDQDIREKWEEILHAKLKVKSFLIEMGLDYFTYGNSFVSVVITKARRLKNPETGEFIPFNSAIYKFRNWKFFPVIDGIESPTPWVIEDVPVKSISNFKLIRWNPENIDIDYNPITGTSTYYYDIPNDIANKIRRGDRGILQDIPLIFLDAVKEKKSLQLDASSMFHFKRPGLAEQGMAWGKPLILPALKKIFYLQTLQRGNEAVAHEHIVPKKAISPAASGSVDPFTSMNMGKWANQVESQVLKWKKDPNHIAVFPIPMQYQELGGNARALLLTQEMNFLEEVIINSLGVPTEFIKGGASWTGSSISLRIVENMFLSYRSHLIDFVNQFLIPKLGRHLDIKPVKLAFKKFKMSDDAQAKQLNIQLAQMNKISDQRLLEEFGFNAEDEFELMAKDTVRTNEFERESGKARAISQGEGQVLLAKYAIRAEQESQREQIRLRLQLLKDELNREQGGDIDDPMPLIESLALQFMFSPEAQQNEMMTKMSQRTPVLFALVMERLELFQTQGLPSNIQSLGVDRPNAQQPGSREKDQLDPTKEKTKGNTRGEPT